MPHNRPSPTAGCEISSRDRLGSGPHRLCRGDRLGRSAASARHRRADSSGAGERRKAPIWPTVTAPARVGILHEIDRLGYRFPLNLGERPTTMRKTMTIFIVTGAA